MDDRRNSGFTLLELVVALSVFLMAVLTTAAVVLPVSQQNRQSDVRGRVLLSAQSLLEEIRGTPPEQVEATYHGETFPVEYAEGSTVPAEIISVAVEGVAPDLDRVTITATWLVGGNEESLVLQTELHSP